MRIFFNCDNTTKIWLKMVSDEKGTVRDQNYYIDKSNIKHVVNGTTVKLNHTKYEKAVAKWYAKTKKKNLRMLPEVSFPQNIKSADFIESTSKYTWEIKEPTGNTINTTIPNQFKNQKGKAARFIIDIHLSNMNVETAIKEINKILSHNRYSWVKEVILLKELELIKFFTKKR